MFCWGENYTSTPTVVPLPFPAVSIAVGSYHECFALEDGSVWCRGWNAYGQRGLGHLLGDIMDAPTRATLCPSAPHDVLDDPLCPGIARGRSRASTGNTGSL